MLTWNETFIQTGHFELILQNIRFRYIWITFPRKYHAENSNFIIPPHISDELNFHYFKVLYEAEILTPPQQVSSLPFLYKSDNNNL